MSLTKCLVHCEEKFGFDLLQFHYVCDSLTAFLARNIGINKIIRQIIQAFWLSTTFSHWGPHSQGILVLHCCWANLPRYDSTDSSWFDQSKSFASANRSWFIHICSCCGNGQSHDTEILFSSLQIDIIEMVILWNWLITYQHLNHWLINALLCENWYIFIIVSIYFKIYAYISRIIQKVPAHFIGLRFYWNYVFAKLSLFLQRSKKSRVYYSTIYRLCHQNIIRTV